MQDKNIPGGELAMRIICSLLAGAVLLAAGATAEAGYPYVRAYYAPVAPVVAYGAPAVVIARRPVFRPYGPPAYFPVGGVAVAPVAPVVTAGYAPVVTARYAPVVTAGYAPAVTTYYAPAPAVVAPAYYYVPVRNLYRP